MVNILYSALSSAEGVILDTAVHSDSVCIAPACLYALSTFKYAPDKSTDCVLGFWTVCGSLNPW